MCTEEHNPRTRYTHSYTLPPHPAISIPGHLPRHARDPLPIRRSLLKDTCAKEQRKSRAGSPRSPGRLAVVVVVAAAAVVAVADVVATAVAAALAAQWNVNGDSFCTMKRRVG
jgi:hypothetical protein